ncbi:hypothetical protein, variant [Aphanomyces invadans]|uniref:Uncharacterized protein n=1 Tax=Aphanomyces invadans TaxID=157072 RepID=A0A024THU5_9STRA|nr:hypothetical protein, variant [Aphanomyces invadans]ETV93166.1 hypothetical protein, variant [Aphanomyces invadans]|eukprot:XP_008878187.1 hypothetical protein, variant [Aphanomyces invadans]
MSQGTTSNAVVEMLAIVDKRLARRRYFRDKQREHRRKVNADVEAAEAELHHVQWVLERLQRARPGVPPKEPSDGPLSWHSIAAVFQRETHRVLTDHQSLATQTQQYKSLATLMQRFVNVNIPPPMANNTTWQSASLAAEPNARRVGKEWLTQQMYHNMHVPFRLFPAVRVDEEYYHFDMPNDDDDDGPLMSMEVMQCIWPGTLATFRRFAESKMSAIYFNDPDAAVEERTANTRLYHLTTERGTFVNPLQGHFIEADRFVMVIRQIEHDEVHVCTERHRQRHYMSWYVRRWACDRASREAGAGLRSSSSLRPTSSCGT